MEFTTLVQRINESTQNNVLTLDLGSSADFEELLPFFEPFVPGGRLVIEQVVPQGTNQQQQTLSGTGVIRLIRLGAQQPLPLRFVFGIVDEQPHLALYILFPPQSSMAAIIDELRGTLFEQIYCRQSIVVISSRQFQDANLQATVQPGFNLLMQLDPRQGALAKIAWMLDATQLVILSGTRIFHPTYGPQFELSLTVADARLRAIFGQRFVQATVQLKHRYRPDSRRLEAGVSIVVTVSLGNQPVALAGMLTQRSDLLELQAAANALPSPQALLPLIAQQNATALLPKSYKSLSEEVLESVSAHSLSLGIGLATQRIEYTELVLASSQSWKMLSDQRGTLAQTRVHLVQAQGQVVQAALTGTLTIADVTFRCEANGPEYLPFTVIPEGYSHEQRSGRTSLSFQAMTVAQLRSSFTYPVLQVFAISDAEDQPSFDPVSFLLDSTKLLACEAIAASDWHFKIGDLDLSVSDISLDLSDAENPLTGYMRIANSDFEVVARQDDDEWFLRAIPSANADFAWSAIAAPFNPNWLVPNITFTKGFIDIDLDNKSIRVSGNPAPKLQLDSLKLAEVGVYYQEQAVLLSALLLLNKVLVPVVVGMVPLDPDLKIQAQPNKAIPDLASLQDLLGGVDLSKLPIAPLFVESIINELRVDWSTQTNKLATTYLGLTATKPWELIVAKEQVLIRNVEIALQLDFTKPKPLVAVIVAGTIRVPKRKIAAPVLIDLLDQKWTVEKPFSPSFTALVTKPDDILQLLLWLLKPVTRPIAVQLNRPVTVRKGPKRVKQNPSSSLSVSQEPKLDLPDFKFDDPNL